MDGEIKETSKSLLSKRARAENIAAAKTIILCSISKNAIVEVEDSVTGKR